MIIKGRARKDGDALAKYLLKESDRQQVRVMDLRDSASPDLTESLTDWETTAKALSKGEKTLYHVQIRLAEGEHLTRQQWMHTVGKLEAWLGLDNCARAIVGHQLDGQLHLHVVWSRLDPDREKLVHLSNDRKAHHEVARAAEKEFGLRQLNQQRDREQEQTKTRERGTAGQRDKEYHQAKRSGTSREQVQKLVSAAFAAADNPAAFDANLKRYGIVLQQGDRRDYVIEHRGQTYNPVRFIPGMTAEKMRQKMQGYDPPTREEAAAHRRVFDDGDATRRARSGTEAQRQAQARAVFGEANDNAAPDDVRKRYRKVRARIDDAQPTPKPRMRDFGR